MSELQEIKDDVKEIKSDVKSGFANVNRRVSKLELESARREGRESMNKTIQLDWKKVTLSLLGIIGTGLSLAYLILSKVIHP